MTAAKRRRAPNKRPHPSKGIPLSAERRELIKRTTPRGKDHGMWLGDDVGYSGVHIWLIKTHGKATHCEFVDTTCTKKSATYEWANISGEYRRDKTDYMQLCKSCHVKYDMKPDTLLKMSQALKGKIPPNRRKIKQYSLDNKFIREFESVAQAAEKLNILRTSISNNLRGSSKHAGGFIWH